MTKAFSLLIILAMAVQFMRPLGLPGLKKRSDAWKLAVAALFAIMLVAVTKESDARSAAEFASPTSREWPSPPEHRSSSLGMSTEPEMLREHSR